MPNSLRLPGLRWGLPLMLCALLLRIAVPAGWMPGASGNGTAITICTGTGIAQAWIDADGKVHKGDGKQPGQEQRCAYAVLGTAALAAPGAPDLTSADPARTSLTGAPFHVAIGQGLAAPPPPSTGPPSLI